MTHTPIANYLERMYKYKNAPFRIKSNGVGVFLVDGNEVSMDEWKACNPVPQVPPSVNATDNPDKTRSYIYE